MAMTLLHRSLRWSLILWLIGACLAGHPARVSAQDVSESLSSLNEDNGKLYIGPLSTGLAAALNSGFYHTADVHEVLGFDIGFRVMGSFVPGDLDTFQPVLRDTVTVEGRTFYDPYGPAGSSGASPTVAGEGDGIVLTPQGEFRDSLLAYGQNPADWNVRFPQGFDIPIAPYAAIQGALGIPLGTELVLRFIPSFTPSDDGTTLTYDISATDPATFTETVTYENYVTFRWQPTLDFLPYDCIEEDRRPRNAQ